MSIQEKKEDVKLRFEDLKVSIQRSQKMISDENKQLAAKMEELNRLQGEYRVLEELEETVVEELPTKKTKKK